MSTQPKFKKLLWCKTSFDCWSTSTKGGKVDEWQRLFAQLTRGTKIGKSAHWFAVTRLGRHRAQLATVGCRCVIYFRLCLALGFRSRFLFFFLLGFLPLALSSFPPLFGRDFFAQEIRPQSPNFYGRCPYQSVPAFRQFSSLPCRLCSRWRLFKGEGDIFFGFFLG